MYYQATMVTANSWTQKKIATRAPEAELYEIVRTAKVMLYIKGLLQDMGEPVMDIAILTDSKPSAGTAYSPISARYRDISVTINLLKQVIA